jgi:hypothetical protein
MARKGGEKEMGILGKRRREVEGRGGQPCSRRKAVRYLTMETKVAEKDERGRRWRGEKERKECRAHEKHRVGDLVLANTTTEDDHTRLLALDREVVESADVTDDVDVEGGFGLVCRG